MVLSAFLTAMPPFSLPPPPLPPLDSEVMQYSNGATSAYQRFIRGKATDLRDHVCKEMNELNLERCRCIPKDQPGADWRVLQEIIQDHPDICRVS